MSQAQGEVVVEGVVVEQPAEPAAVRATTAGEIFGISEQTVSVPPGDVGLTFDWPLVVKEVAAGSPLFGRVQAGAALVAVDGVRATPYNIRHNQKKGQKDLLDATKAKTLIFQTGTGLGGVKYVGREGIVGPLMSTDAVVDVFAMDRGLFDAANAAKARTHWLHGEPGHGARGCFTQGASRKVYESLQLSESTFVYRGQDAFLDGLSKRMQSASGLHDTHAHADRKSRSRKECDFVLETHHARSN